MKTETLHALLIDRSLGELTPDAAELLDAYLARDPAAAAGATEYRRTIAAARAAAEGSLTTQPGPSLPAWQAPRDGFLRQRRGELMRLAASLIVGASIGWAAFDLRTSTRSRPAPFEAETAADKLARAAPRATASFWSVAGLSHSVPAWPPVDRSVQRLRWESPMTMPQLEENK